MNRSTVDKLFTVTNLLHSGPRNRPVDAYKKRSRPGKLSFRKKTTNPVLILGLGKLGQKRMLVLGRVMLYTSFVSYMAGYLSHEWVCRVYDTTEDRYNTVIVNRQLLKVPPNQFYCFGLWKACGDTGTCERVWFKLGLSPMTVVGVLIMATNALTGYGMAVLLDLASRFGLMVFLGVNRVVEFCTAVSVVLQFMALLHFTGQMKNRAPIVHGVCDVTGWGFILASVPLFTSVLSVVLMALFRSPLAMQKHRQFWKLPADLRPRSNLASSKAGAGRGGGEGARGGGDGESTHIVKVRERNKAFGADGGGGGVDRGGGGDGAGQLQGMELKPREPTIRA
ncbi:uncharacterized protein [Littorina saxatilis]|uniref:uncharacterized protein isoform X2 n=1 Tax=Littorina saxatilis TaxID=31220 RepID=UPI0038B65053